MLPEGQPSRRAAIKTAKLMAGTVLVWAAVPVAWVLLVVLRVVARLRQALGGL